MKYLRESYNSMNNDFNLLMGLGNSESFTLSITLDFNLLFKYDLFFSFVSLECSLQYSEIRFEVRSDDLR